MGCKHPPSFNFCKMTILHQFQFRELIGGLWNQPGIDTNGEIHKFCVDVASICVKKGVTIKTGASVKKINLSKDNKGK